MRTATVNVFEFNELSDKAKEVARNWYREATAGEDWWDSVYEDASEIGLKLAGFDIGPAFYAMGSLTGTHSETAAKIVATHGKSCHTHKLACAFQQDSGYIAENASRGVESEYTPDELEATFLRDLLHAYAVNLRQQSEYNESDECIDENIVGGEYDFTANGKRFVSVE